MRVFFDHVARVFAWMDAVEFASYAISAVLLLATAPPLACLYFLADEALRFAAPLRQPLDLVHCHLHSRFATPAFQSDGPRAWHALAFHNNDFLVDG